VNRGAHAEDPGKHPGPDVRSRTRDTFTFLLIDKYWGEDRDAIK